MLMDLAEKILLFVTLSLIVFLNVLLVDNTLGGWGGDNAWYVLLAKSIISGMGYREIFTPGLPPHVHFPPVFSLLLSPIVYLWGYNFLVMHIFVIMLGIFATLAIIALFEDYSNRFTATAVALLTGTNSLFLAYQQEILSEIPYLLFSLLSLYFIKNYLKKKTVLNLQLILASLFISLTYMTRSIGVSVYFAFVFYLIIKLLYTDNKASLLKKGFALAILSIIPYLIWSFRNLKGGGVASDYYMSFYLIDPYAPEKGYAGFSDLLHGIYINLFLYQTVLTENIAKLSLSPIPLFITGFAVAGFCYAIYKRKEVTEFYVLFYTVILLCWPYKETERFIVPIIPFIYMYIILAAKRTVSLLKEENKLFPNLIGFILCFILLASNLWVLKDIFSPNYVRERIFNSRIIIRNIFTKINYVNPDDVVKGEIDPRIGNYCILSAWFRENSKDSDIIVGRKPSITALLSERQVVEYPFLSDKDKMIQYFEDNAITYVIVDTFSETTYKYLMPAIAKYPERFSYVTGNAVNGRIVKFLPSIQNNKVNWK